MSTPAPASTRLTRPAAALGFLVLATVASRAVVAAILPREALAFDMKIWEQVTDFLLHGGNPYASTELLFYPPLWMQVLYGLGRISMRTQIPLFHLIQIVLIVSDVATVIATYLLLRMLGLGSKAFWFALVGFALNPISIFMTCMQCNFDPWVGLLMVLACLALVTWNRGAASSVWLLACLAIGLGVLAKSVPVIAAPILLARWRQTDWASRVMGPVLVIGPALLAVSIIYVLSPHQVASNIFGYRSSPGWFGISGLVNLVSGEQAAKAYARFFPIIAVAVLASATWAIGRPRRISDSAIVLGCALLLWWVPTFGPGYGPQYIGWFLPLTVVLFAVSRGSLRLSIAVFGGVALATYVEEYALVTTQGAFFTLLVPSTKDLAVAVTTQPAQTLLRLPLFLAYVGMVIAGVSAFARMRRWDLAPSSQLTGPLEPRGAEASR